MNIKGLLGSNITQQIKPVERAERAVKSDITHDRDSNGRQEYGQSREEHPQRPMTKEELEKSMNHLKGLGVVKEHKWTIDLVEENEKKYVLVKDNLGIVIRKIPEVDLWSLNFSEEPSSKGQLLKKSA